MNRTILFAAVGLILFAILAAGLFDLTLYLTGRPTISAFLRSNIGWFWGPVAFTAAFLTGLGFHLYFNG